MEIGSTVFIGQAGPKGTLLRLETVTKDEAIKRSGRIYAAGLPGDTVQYGVVKVSQGEMTVPAALLIPKS